jgi:hypothetical protein
MWAACSKIQAVTDPERVGRLQEKSTRAKQNQLGTAADWKTKRRRKLEAEIKTGRQWNAGKRSRTQDSVSRFFTGQETKRKTSAPVGERKSKTEQQTDARTRTA